MEEKTVRVRVPGTSANCGPGFDTLGLACTIYNDLDLTLKREPGLTITMSGEGAANIPKDNRNIVWRSVQYLLRKAGRAEEFRGAVIHMDNQVPLSRGLGSSATAIVAGLTGANELLGRRYRRQEILQMATEIEGHPDNVAPAIFGGFTINTVTKGRVRCFYFLPRTQLDLVVAVPDFYLPTRVARKALPENVPMKDAVYNVGRAAMLTAALLRGNERFLQGAFEDALHQPYRAKLIPGMYDVFKAARDAGALGASLSGAGPCLIAYVPKHRECTEAVGAAMKETFRQHEVNAEILNLELDTKGAQIIEK